MFANIKELIVVMALAMTVFALAKRTCLDFMRLEDFVRRRNLWLALTVCAFLSPSFWLYVGVAAVASTWAARRDPNPVSLYLLLFAVIPPLAIYIPVVGVNQLFALSQSRLLALVVLIPLSLRMFAVNEDGIARKWTALDIAVVSYVLLQIALVVPYETVTNTMRRGLLMIIDLLVVYYAFSRALIRRTALVDAMVVFVLVGAISATVGIFEWARGWLLYERIGPTWGAPNLGAFLMRADSLRAQASAGHSLTFGYVLTVALAFWLHLRTYVASRMARWSTTALLCVGIYVSQSRGPWLTGIVVYFSYLLLSPGGAGAFFKGVFSAVVLAVGLAFTPVGSKVIALLPFVGTVEQSNVEYRQTLATESWRLIWQNPIFGDPFVLRQMEDLRQGQGIIDLMNGYATVALFSGLTGLGLLMVVFLGSTIKAFGTLRYFRAFDPDSSSLGAALVAAMAGSLAFMATASIDWVEYVLIGLLCAYGTLASDPGTAFARQGALRARPTAAFGGG
jgi:hypothetical protein